MKIRTDLKMSLTNGRDVTIGSKFVQICSTVEKSEVFKITFQSIILYRRQQVLIYNFPRFVPSGVSLTQLRTDSDTADSLSEIYQNREHV